LAEPNFVEDVIVGLEANHFRQDQDFSKVNSRFPKDYNPNVVRVFGLHPIAIPHLQDQTNEDSRPA
jgi:hypothetical protein